MQIDAVLVILFVAVGMIVSLDVTGLTLSKSDYFHHNPKNLPAWAITNAAWHAGLLFVYISVISGLFKFAPDFLGKIVDALDWLAAQLPVIDIAYVKVVTLVVDSISIRAPVLLGILALYIVWVTYSQKIVSLPSAGTIAELPPLARLVFNLVDLLLIRLVFGSKLKEDDLVRMLYWQAQAALVAIDMLALATLLKSMQVLESWDNSLLVCGIVLVCVFVSAIVAGLLGQRAYVAVQGGGAMQKRLIKLESGYASRCDWQSLI